MKRSIALFLALLPVLSCTEELTQEVTNSIQVSLDGGTKTVLEGRKVYWSTGDRISAGGVESSALQDVAPQTSCVTFTLPQSVSYPVPILYPSTFRKDAQTVKLPSLQKRAEGSFASGTAPCAGVLESSEGAATLKNLCAVVKLPLTSSHSHPVKGVILKGGNGEQLCGDFTIDYTAGTLTPAGDGNELKLSTDTLTLGQSPETLHFVVPAGTYAGLSFRIIDVENHYMDVCKKSPATLSAGTIYTLPAVDFAPTGTLVDIGQGDFGDSEIKADAPPLRILFIGNSFTDDAVNHLPGLINAAGLGKKVKMAHMYYGGRIMSEYNDWTKADYTLNNFEPGSDGWVQYGSTVSIEDVARSGQWDIITLQEHTGNYHAWVWDAEEKSYFDGMFDKLNATQSEKPEYWYVFSQAYYNMSCIGAGSRTYMTWPLENTRGAQLQMYSVIADFAKNVMKDCPFDGILPTGTMVQNLRTSELDNVMDLTRDGYHMDYGITRYGAACVLFESLITPKLGVGLDGNSYRFSTSNTTSGKYSTPVTDANAPVALAAARAAMSKPYEITDMGPAKDTVTLEGAGTEASPYLLASASDMEQIYDALKLDGTVYFKMTSDIDMSGILDWTPVCVNDAGYVFDFDGDGHTISGFTCSGKTQNSLFGVLNGSVRNLNLSGCSVSAAASCGLLSTQAGSTSGITMQNVHAAGCSVASTLAGNVNTGGLIASASKAVISDCSFCGTVSTKSPSGYNGFTGGLVGQVLSASTFDRCFTDVTVIGTSNNHCGGGLVGGSSGNVAVAVRNCCTSGSMSEISYFGGVIGEIGTGSEVKDCYSTMTLRASYALGGVVGRACNYVNPNSKGTFDTDIDISVTGCIAWNPSITSTNKKSPSSGYSSGAVVAFNVNRNTLASCWRRPDMEFDMYPETAYNTLVDQPDFSPASPYVKLGSETYYMPYHGKAAADSVTVSTVARGLGWDGSIWDLSGDYPRLEGMPARSGEVNRHGAGCMDLLDVIYRQTGSWTEQ